MAFKDRYPKYKESFLKDEKLCSENKALFKKYFEWHERKLKSINNLREIDESSYKTLYHYVCCFRNVVKWFSYKPLKKITKAEFKQVYEDLEDGKILNSYGKPFEDRASYYGKVFKGKLFKMIGKHEYAEEILEFSRPEKNKGKVRYFTKEDFDKMSMVAIRVDHKALLNLCWDIGENIMTIIKLQKKDCRRYLDKDTGEPAYIITLPKEKIKRSRTARSEPTNFSETVKLLDMLFQQKKKKFSENSNGKSMRRYFDNEGVRRKIDGDWKELPFEEEDYLFDFGQKQAEQIFRRIVEKTGVMCMPDGDKPTLKDLRSSMACHLLKEGWTLEEIKGRMGHKPSSSVIDKYVTHLALDKRKPQKKIYESNIRRFQEQLEESKNREKLYNQRIENLKDEITRFAPLLKLVEGNKVKL